jgi:hypothetical protein
MVAPRGYRREGCWGCRGMLAWRVEQDQELPLKIKPRDERTPWRALAG